MLVRGHSFMWILPVVSVLCAFASGAVHNVSQVLVAAYRYLPVERQAWFCADVVHLVYSGAASLAALYYLHSTPSALNLHAQPQDQHLASVIIAASTGDLLRACGADQLCMLQRHKVCPVTAASDVRIIGGIISLGCCRLQVSLPSTCGCVYAIASLLALYHQPSSSTQPFSCCLALPCIRRWVSTALQC